MDNESCNEALCETSRFEIYTSEWSVGKTTLLVGFLDDYYEK